MSLGEQAGQVHDPDLPGGLVAASSPSRAIWSRIWSAMPTPAVPPPKMTTRWSRHRVPVTFSALNSPGHDDRAGALHVVVEDPVRVPVG